MSYNSNKNSGSGRGGFIKRRFGQEGDKSVRKIEAFKRPLEFKVLEGSPPISGRMPKPTSSVPLSTGIRELSSEGYIVYNIPEKEDIYISLQSENDDFDDAVKMVKMEIESPLNIENSSVLFKNSRNITENQEEAFIYTQASDLFVNANKKEEIVEIDFSEVIIKIDIEESQNTEESFRPKGLYLEGNEQSLESTSDDVVLCESMVSSNLLNELAVTSESVQIPMVCQSFVTPQINVDNVEYVSNLSEWPKTYAIDDIEEILPITIPELYSDEKSLKDLPEDKDLMIPEDGLESYDFKFKPFDVIKAY